MEKIVLLSPLSGSLHLHPRFNPQHSLRYSNWKLLWEDSVIKKREAYLYRPKECDTTLLSYDLGRVSMRRSEINHDWEEYVDCLSWSRRCGCEEWELRRGREDKRASSNAFLIDYLNTEVRRIGSKKFSQSTEDEFCRLVLPNLESKGIMRFHFIHKASSYFLFFFAELFEAYFLLFPNFFDFISRVKNV